MLTLAIAHEIFLTKQERYALAKGQPIDTIGVSVPVWFYKGNTSEPASEIFCKYRLINTPDEAEILKGIKDGYLINIPQIPKDYIPSQPISNKTWRKMPEISKSKWYAQNREPISGKNLLDPIDGGGACIKFIEQTVMMQNSVKVNIHHNISIKDVQVLEESLI